MGLPIQQEHDMLTGLLVVKTGRVRKGSRGRNKVSFLCSRIPTSAGHMNAKARAVDVALSQ